jgi:hypothetical protein
VGCVPTLAVFVIFNASCHNLNSVVSSLFSEIQPAEAISVNIHFTNDLFVQNCAVMCVWMYFTCTVQILKLHIYTFLETGIL